MFVSGTIRARNFFVVDDFTHSNQLTLPHLGGENVQVHVELPKFVCRFLINYVHNRGISTDHDHFYDSRT